ncbi:MAG: hypothetical protein AB7O26_02490 [Planctomycetaceae bacterium]
MSTTEKAAEEYRLQITQCTQAMALAQNESVERFLKGPAAAEGLKLFTDGNLDKRYLKLLDHFEEMAEEFDGFDELVERFVRCVPLAAYDTGSSDSQRFLDWLCGTRRLNESQRDHVTCQRSRYAIELAAECHRLAHVRFQEILSTCESLSPQLDIDSPVWIHLNPIHAWGVFRTRTLLDDESELPATVLFYPVAGTIHTAVLDPFAEFIVRELEARGPARFGDLSPAPLETTRSELLKLCRDLADVGIVAFG